MNGANNPGMPSGQPSSPAERFICLSAIVFMILVFVTLYYTVGGGSK